MRTGAKQKNIFITAGVCAGVGGFGDGVVRIHNGFLPLSPKGELGRIMNELFYFADGGGAF